MTKFLKRIGTKKINYEFEILVEKIEIKNQGPCTLSVLMKRGYSFFILTKSYFNIYSELHLVIIPLPSFFF